MKTIILCGGIGYRLKEETEFKPKPMVYVGGKPMIWHIMKIYSQYGYNDFVIALGYKGNVVKEYFLNQKYFANDFTLDTKGGRTKVYKNGNSEDDDFHITFVDTGQATLPGERILRVMDYIPDSDEHFMVTYGDGVADIDIKKLISFHKNQGTTGTITGVHPHSKYGLLKTNDRGVIVSFTEKPILNEFVNGGFMVFKRDFFNYLNPGEYEHPALKRLVEKQQLSLYVHDGFWQCMDTYPDVDLLNKLWNEDPKWKVW